ncbi:MAG: hypothetical protein Q8Q09_10945 [Deltaproteobacteria bacterium]|nr:hypothetical protein [Deltaproteobacteria bacterium]
MGARPTVTEHIADEVAPLVDAMNADERASFADEEQSRRRLRALVEDAAAWGDVEVFGCWSGDELAEAVRTEFVASSWFTEQLTPIEERVRYVVNAR